MLLMLHQVKICVDNNDIGNRFLIAVEFEASARDVDDISVRQPSIFFSIIWVYCRVGQYQNPNTNTNTNTS